MGLTFGLIVLPRIFCGVPSQANFGISCVTVGASQAHGAGAVHSGAVGGSVAGETTRGFAVGFGLGLQQKDVRVRLSMGRNQVQDCEA
jgi:hypothetical protein